MKAGRPTALLVVTQSSGSAPGKTGFKMAITLGQSSFGTIGGGIMEYRLVERLQEHLTKGEPFTQHLEQVHHENAPADIQSGMICAGKQWIAIHILRPQEQWVVNRLADDRTRGQILLGPEGLAFQEADEPLSWETWYKESVGIPDTVSIIGGGHVGLALSRALTLLDFQLHVYDHRQNLDTLARVNCPKTVVDYHELGSLIPGGPHSYAVIVTTGFLSDAEALYQLIGKNLRYLGLMGSAAKIKRIFQNLKERGVAGELLDDVRAPVGIPIYNKTPAEIAVSIAAELIMRRNKDP